MNATTIQTSKSKATSITRLWSEDEHDRFLAALKKFPRGPWRMIAAQVGTRTPRQVQTHAQKYYEKVDRRLRGLRKDRKNVVRSEHRLDEDMEHLCQIVDHGAENSRIGPFLGRGLSALVTVFAITSSATESARTEESGLSQSNASGSDLAVPSDVLSANDATGTSSLADLDETYLGYLMEVLECASECASDDNSSEFDLE
ncbi:Myb-like dna-binding protein, partial [Globisporangium splendens]